MLPRSAPGHGIIEWYGPDMNTQAKGRPNFDQVEVKVTYHVDTVRAVKEAADRIALAAEFKLSAHHDTGDAEIGVWHRHNSSQLLDSLVYLRATDEGTEEKPISPKDSARAAWAIEHGWTMEDGREVPGIGALAYGLRAALKTRRMGLDS